MDPGSPPAHESLGTQPQPQAAAADAADAADPAANSEPASPQVNKPGEPAPASTPTTGRSSTRVAASETIAGLDSDGAGPAAHRGWDISGVSTSKCDLCHQQRCGAIQKCRECKLSVCRPCSIAGRLDSDPRHALDPDAVSWAVAPSATRRRRAKAAHAGVADFTSVSVSAPPAASRRRASDQGPSPAAAEAGDSAPHDGERPVVVLRPRHPGPVEPWICVGPESPYHRFAPPRGCRPFALFPPHVLASRPSANRHPQHPPTAAGHDTSAGHPHPPSLTRPPNPAPPPASPSCSSSVRACPSPRRRRRSDSLLSRLRLQIYLADPIREHRPRHQHEAWPIRGEVEALGSHLAGVVRDMHALWPNIPLEVHLRDEVARFYFIAQDDDLLEDQHKQETALRMLFAAMPVVATELGIPSDNAAGLWLEWARAEQTIRAS